MVMFFDLAYIENSLKLNNTGLIKYIQDQYYLYVHKVPCDKQIFQGDSYLINPYDLFKDKTDSVYKVHYLRLAGRRNYLYYKVFGCTFLDISLYPDLNYDTVNNNPLLTIKNNKLHFKYEHNLTKEAIQNGNKLRRSKRLSKKRGRKIPVQSRRQHS